MATHAHKAKVASLNNRINILNKNAVEASPTNRVFRTVGNILALVRVSALPHPLVSSY